MNREQPILRTSIRQRAVAPDAMRVLLVDDTPSMVALYEHILRAEGFAVTTATDGPRALASLVHSCPDIIVLDMNMPGMSGDEVLERIRKNEATAHVPVVFLTATGDDEGIIGRAFELGADDYLMKPIQRRLLVERVRSIVQSRRARARAHVSERKVQEQERVMEDVRGAETVQRGQLPTLPIAWDHWRIFGSLRPCDQISGDLYDVIEGENGERTVALVDVSGHGFGAAMVASSVRSLLRLLLATRPFEEVLPELNRQLCAANDGHFACVALIRVDARTVRVTNAGLPPVVIMRGGRIVATVASSGLPPGIRPNARYQDEARALHAGMRVVAVTDGLTEPLGAADAVGELIGRLDLSAPSRELTQGAVQARVAKLFADRPVAQEDDATLLLLDYS